MSRAFFACIAALSLPLASVARRARGEEGRGEPPRPGGRAPLRAVVRLDGRALVFDEARGEDLGDFEGPGFVQRCVRVLRDADEIVLEELVANNLYRKTAQVFAVLLPIGTVGVMGDARSYDSVVAIRAVESQDFMTADWARIPFDVLAQMSNRIINEVRGVNRVVYDISSKPPATIEWE